jgi:hypothetical protein
MSTKKETIPMNKYELAVEELATYYDAFLFPLQQRGKTIPHVSAFMLLKELQEPNNKVEQVLDWIRLTYDSRHQKIDDVKGGPFDYLRSVAKAKANDGYAPFCPTPPTTYDLRYGLRYSVWRQGTETTHDNLYFVSGKGFFDPSSKSFGPNFWVVAGGRGTGKSLLCERLTTLGDDTVAIEVQDITKVPARLLRRSTNVVSLKQLLPPFPAEVERSSPTED